MVTWIFDGTDRTPIAPLVLDEPCQPFAATVMWCEHEGRCVAATSMDVTEDQARCLDPQLPGGRRVDSVTPLTTIRSTVLHPGTLVA